MFPVSQSAPGGCRASREFVKGSEGRARNEPEVRSPHTADSGERNANRNSVTVRFVMSKKTPWEVLAIQSVNVLLASCQLSTHFQIFCKMCRSSENGSVDLSTTSFYVHFTQVRCTQGWQLMCLMAGLAT